jgi:hypothetical protein
MVVRCIRSVYEQFYFEVCFTYSKDPVVQYQYFAITFKDAKMVMCRFIDFLSELIGLIDNPI